MSPSMDSVTENSLKPSKCSKAVTATLKEGKNDSSMNKPCSRGSLHVSILIGIDPEGAALFFTRNKVPANGNCCSPCIQKQLLSFSRGSMVGKMAPSMDECSRPVRLTSRIEETQNLTSQSRVFFLRHQKSDEDLHKNSSLSLTFLQWQHLLELALVP